jgi:hypothetical protein
VTKKEGAVQPCNIAAKTCQSCAGMMTDCMMGYSCLSVLALAAFMQRYTRIRA